MVESGCKTPLTQHVEASEQSFPVTNLQFEHILVSAISHSSPYSKMPFPHVETGRIAGRGSITAVAGVLFHVFTIAQTAAPW
jgi:hypothetical protein